jgi:peptidoglycan/LPS O-acetylase OafA/YrhL
MVQLDVYRAIAVVLVLASHTRGTPDDFSAYIVGLASFFRRYGHLGVDLFFVLSGFLVSGLLFREYLHTGSIALRRFLIRRGLKIYPAFYIFLAITVLLRMQQGSTFSLSDILCEAFFVQNYGPSVWSHTWSLAVEEHFYLFLAALVFLLMRVRSASPFRYLGGIVLVVTITVVSLRVVTYELFPYSNKTHWFPTHLRIDELLFGVFLSYYYHMKPGFVPAVKRLAIPILVLSIALLIGSQVALDDRARYALGPVLLAAGFGGVLLVSMCFATPTRGWCRHFLSFAGYIGSHSYSIYLWHTAVLVFGALLARKILGYELDYWPSFACYMSSSILFGIIMAKCVEIPVLRLRDRFFPSQNLARGREVSGLAKVRVDQHSVRPAQPL